MLHLTKDQTMRPFRIVLPLLLALSITACAGNAGAAGGTQAAQPRAELLNRSDAVRLVRHRFAGVPGEAVVQVTLDASGAVTGSTIRRSTHTAYSQAALEIAPQLRFTRPAAAGEQVNVRMRFADVSGASIAVVN